jgi:D-alanyl-D-alanine carboxypeptidase (penicillin-binding protein 5/6)
MPVSALKPVVKNLNQPVEPLQVTWPAYGQSAIGEKSAGLLSASTSQNPQPTASVAKVMTALAVLRQKPLEVGQPGPMITLSDTDVESYNEYISKDGSVVKVVKGEKITQYQALQAMLLPSANNMADSLARWAFGSTRDYTVYANSLALSLGMKQTTIADASGYSPQTMSTAGDLVTLASIALREPVIAQIVAQSTATIPVQGEIKNVNWLLGTDGVNGIKTGNTEQAGGCFMVSAERTLANGEKKTVIAVILGAPTRNKAITDSKPLLTAVTANYVPVKVVAKGQTIGYYGVSWGKNVTAIAKQDLSVNVWRGTTMKPNIVLNEINVPMPAGTSVGKISVKNQTQTTEVVLASTVTSPPASWRLRRAYQL